MKDALVLRLEQQKSGFSPCPVCPVTGTCVLVTPGREPGYRLHEYQLLHSYVAQRLRVHPPAGVSEFARLTMEARRFVDHVRSIQQLCDSGRAAWGDARPLLPIAAWPAQAILADFVGAAG